MQTNISGKHLIDGRWAGGGGETFSAASPLSSEPLTGEFFEAGRAEVDAAARAAEEAFLAAAELEPRWAAKLLDAIADEIVGAGDALLERLEAETGLPRARTTGERARTCGQLKMFAEVVREGSWVDAVIESADPARTPLPKPDLRRMLRPRGPVVVFGASNFPLAFGACGGDTASALAAGCPVIVKGHPAHPGTSELLAAAVLDGIDSCKLPTGMFQLLQGRRNELSAMLVQHPAIAAVGFTGSNKAGRALFDLAAAREKPIPVFAEMGSLNPLVILPAAAKERREKIAAGLAGSLLLGGGQFCTKPGLMFLVGEDTAFVRELSDQLLKTASVTMLNKNLRDNFTSRISSFEKVPGVKRIVGGEPTGNATATPTLFETSPDVWLKNPALHEEAFGPGGLLVRCESADEAIDCIRQVSGSLTGTIHIGDADDIKTTQRILRELETICGRVIINGYPTGLEVCGAIVHGGPYPATTDSGSTSVGTAAIRRFVRMVAYQDTPQNLLPPALKNENPLGIWRTVNGERTR